MPFFDFEEALDMGEGHGDILKQLRFIREKAKENNLIYKQEYAKQYNKKFEVEPRVLAPGDEIFLENNHKTATNPKFQPNFLGPFEVVEVDETNVFYKYKGHTKTAHLNRVKRARSSRIPEEKTRVDTFLSRKKVGEEQESHIPSIKRNIRVKKNVGKQTLRGHSYATRSKVDDTHVRRAHAISDSSDDGEHPDSEREEQVLPRADSPALSETESAPSSEEEMAFRTPESSPQLPRTRAHIKQRDAQENAQMKQMQQEPVGRSTRSTGPAPELPLVPRYPPEYKAYIKNKCSGEDHSVS